MKHPGLSLATELKRRKIKQIDLSRRIGIAKTQLNEVLKGKRPVSIDLALWLEWLLINTADYWTDLQRAYDLEKARQTFNPQIRNV